MSFKNVLEEAKKAFCDAWDDKHSFDELKNIRNLNWRASKDVSCSEAIRIMSKAVPNGYNAFEASLLSLLPKNSRIVLAREGSVCVYLLGVKRLTMKLRQELKADEYDNIGDLGFRIWWD